jgi:hypothetical protein
MYYARKAVKERLQASGYKLREVAASDLTIAARAYLIQHPELMAKAKAICEELHREHAAKLAARRAARKPPCETTTIPVQQSGAK